MNSNEHIGIWWLPGERERQFEGRLTLETGNGGVLKLTDWVDKLAEPSAFDWRRKYDLVLRLYWHQIGLL